MMYQKNPLILKNATGDLLEDINNVTHYADETNNTNRGNEKSLFRK